MRLKLDEGLETFAALKVVFNITKVKMVVKRVTNEREVVQSLTYKVEIWRMMINERHNLDVMEMECLISMFRVIRIECS